MTDRKLATIRRIDSLDPIEGADKIECASIGGWKVVVQKGLYNVGDLAVYCEIDSWLPTALAPFLTKPGHYPKVFEGVEGERLKTIKLRGQVSQGLLLPITVCWSGAHERHVNGSKCPWDFQGDWNDGTFQANGLKPVDILVNGEWTTGTVEGLDVTEYLGILKWEKPLPAQLQGRVRGNFPWYIPKTDQERIQNLTRQFHEHRNEGSLFEVTEKVDGSSMTVFVNKEGLFGVCSRNLELIETEGNAYWDTARKQDLENKIYSVLDSKMIDGCGALAIQGELLGPGIQGNIYKLDEITFVVYDIFDISNQQYLLPPTRRSVCNRFGFYHVPVLWVAVDLKEYPDIATLLTVADGPSMLRKETMREGLVLKHCTRNFSFKIISNKFLLKHGDD